ncbi:LysR family transcriptional regulator [Hydrogenophaga sp. 2FB]|uniref:LysR family transcriptional regulator n=1 Tax=Hydrogenophaga sp. 2FB TaxID=2502187 RepID=UPI0014850CCE|nr:LysR family transcriptional regulator [Hydrogenophaga sp. 2FB]
MRSFDLTSLELFVSACETGSMVKAAQRAHIVTSAVSKRMSQLEARVGVPLFARKAHGMAPTDAGLALLEHARAVLNGVDRMDQDMQAYAAGGGGYVRILASGSPIVGPLVSDISTFLKSPGNKNVHVEMEECNSPGVIEGVRLGAASLGVCWDATSKVDLQTLPYYSEEVCLLVPQTHQLASRSEVKLTDLLAFPVVGGQPLYGTLQGLIDRLAAQAGLHLDQKIVVHSYEAALRVIASGLAIGIMPSSVAELTGAALGLKQIRLNEPWARRKYLICFRNKADLAPAAQRLLHHLQRNAPSEGASGA